MEKPEFTTASLEQQLYVAFLEGKIEGLVSSTRKTVIKKATAAPLSDGELDNDEPEVYNSTIKITANAFEERTRALKDRIN